MVVRQPEPRDDPPQRADCVQRVSPVRRGDPSCPKPGSSLHPLFHHRDQPL